MFSYFCHLLKQKDFYIKVIISYLIDVMFHMRKWRRRSINIVKNQYQSILEVKKIFLRSFSVLWSDCRPCRRVSCLYKLPSVCKRLLLSFFVWSKASVIIQLGPTTYKSKTSPPSASLILSHLALQLMSSLIEIVAGMSSMHTSRIVRAETHAIASK